jgi:type VI secretion system protein ImpL
MSRNAKTYLIASLIFIVYLAVIIGVALLIHLEGSRFWIFVGVLGVVGLIATIVAVIYKKKAIDANGPPDANAIDIANLEALVKSAEARMKQAKGPVKSLGAMPLVYILGDENAGKTQTILQSGLDAELLAGQTNRDGLVPPTALANIWYTSTAAIVEAGGTLLRQPGLWHRLISSTAPSKLGAALSKGALQPTRAAVVCVSTERVLATNSPETVRALGQALNEQLRVLSKALGITLPVYVLFTKLDTIPSFADYVSTLTNDEIRDPLGSLLSPPAAGAGLYAETATTQIAQRFDELCYSLSEYRLEVLSRGGEPDKLARAYEFPRELRKLRALIVDLLVETGRPSQLGVNPFLRGFYFTGMRARIVEDNAPTAAAQAAPAPSGDGATRVFSFSALQQPAAAPATRGTRRIPQWVFLPHLFTKVFLADRGALETSRASTRVNVVKRLLIGAVAACIFVYLVALTVSYLNNAALESRLRAAAALPTHSVSRGDPASTTDLENLEKLRAVFVQIAGYRKDGAPLGYRFGLYQDDKLYNAACSAYGDHFRTLLLVPTQQAILARLAALPPAPKPSDDYSATYRPFRAYLVTTSNPEKSTVDIESEALQEAWVGDPATRQIPSTSTDLSLPQFQTYSANLAEPGSCLAPLGGAPQAATVAQTRAYLSHFQGIEQVYLSMKAAADRKNSAVRFNDTYPGTKPYVVDSYEVEGAFTKGGYAFMQDAILHPEPYTSGEAWVLGPQTGPTIDRATLNAQLPARYLADFLNAWRTYLKSAHIVSASTFADSKEKLHQLDSPASALMELFALLAKNTSVNNPAYSVPFQAPQSVGGAAAPYITGLSNLEQAINSMLLVPGSQTDPNAVAPVIQAASTAEGSVSAIRGGFTPPDPAGQMDSTSEHLLLEPIKSIEALAKGAPAAAAGGGAKAFCGQIEPVLSKFPFNPDSPADATMDEVAKVFQPGTGMLAQYATSLNKMIVLEGNSYGPIPGSPVAVNPAFLHFLNAAQSIGTTFFPAGGGPPSISFTMLEEATPNLPPATLDIDGSSLTTAGQAKSFTWKSSSSSNIRLQSSTGNSIPASGPWALFHFAYSAKHPAPNRLEEVFEVNGHPLTSPSGAPLDYKFDVGGPGAQFLNPGFMHTQLRCVTKVAQ